MAEDSKLSNVGSRYAQALFDLASDQQQVAAVEADLNSLRNAIAESKDLRTLLASPAFSAEDKANGLAAIAAAGKFDATTRKFLGLLAANQQWFADLQPWVDYTYAQNPLYNGTLTGEQWQHLAVSGALWFILPMAVGLVLVRRAEVK